MKMEVPRPKRFSGSSSLDVTILFVAVLVASVLAVCFFVLFREKQKNLSAGGEEPLPAASAKDLPMHSHPGKNTPGAAGENEDRTVPREAVPARWKAREKAALEGPVLSGRVIDRITGGPPESLNSMALSLFEAGTESAPPREIPFSLYSIDKDGKFTIPLEGLPVRKDAPYTLVCDLAPYVLSFLENLSIPPDRGLSGLVFSLEPKGRLRILGRGYRGNGVRSLTLKLTCGGRPAGEVFWSRPYGEKPRGEYVTVMRKVRASPREADGIWDQTLTLEPGLWEADASIGHSRFKTQAVIEPGRTTEIVVDRGDIGPAFTILGTLKYSDGLPVAGAKLRFRELSGAGRIAEPPLYTTDSTGKFMPLDLVQGVWRLDAWLEDGTTPCFPDIVIPDAPPAPYRLDLVVQRGAVSGTLCDKSTNISFGDDYTRWFLLLRDMDTGRVVAECGNHFGSDFKITSVPRGRLRLEVRARGFVDFASKPFFFEGGRERNMGDVGIERQDRNGSLIVTLTDEEGAPFDKPVRIEVLKPLGRPGLFETIPCGEKGYAWSYLGDGTFRLDRLPAERLILKISPKDPARRFASRDFATEVEYGTTTAVTVELKP